MNNANQRPNDVPITIEEGQNQISLLMKKAYFEKWNLQQIDIQLDIIIKRVLRGLPPILNHIHKDIKTSLTAHANRVYDTLKKSFYNLSSNIENGLISFNLPRNKEEQIQYESKATGTAAGEYQKTYMKERVIPVINKLAGMNALDPNDYTGRNSLRNLAEMEVRYNEHLSSIDRLKEKQTKLVLASSHADCSDRCFPWQGRIYSLDSSYGITEDKRKWVPLEMATDVYYTTKAGKTYKNGLLGFNCRHKLIPYVEGMQPPIITKQQQEEQYEINLKQRLLERRVREQRLKTELYKDIKGLEKLHADSYKKQVQYNREYKEFCRDNERAFYPERVQILKPSNEEEKELYRFSKGLTDEHKLDKIKLQSELLSETLLSDKKTIKGVIPKGTTINNVTVIAGGGVKTPIKDIARFIETYGGNVKDYQKKVGIIEGKYFKHEIHWYSKQGVAFESKVKGSKENENIR